MSLHRYLTALEGERRRAHTRTVHVTFALDMDTLREFAPEGPATYHPTQDGLLATVLHTALCDLLDSAVDNSPGLYTSEASQLAYAVARALNRPRVELVPVLVGPLGYAMDAAEVASQDASLTRFIDAAAWACEGWE